MLCLISVCSFGQWTTKYINNEFDEHYRVAYTETNNNMFLKIESSFGYPCLLICGDYFCDDVSYIDISFYINNKWYPYKIRGEKSNSSEFYTLEYEDTFGQKNFLYDFCNATKCKIRIKQVYCSIKLSEFNMRGSSNAINAFLNSKEFNTRKRIERIQDSINNALICQENERTIIHYLSSNTFINKALDTLHYKSAVDIYKNHVSQPTRRFFVSNDDSIYFEVLNGKIYKHVYQYDSAYNHLIIKRTE